VPRLPHVQTRIAPPRVPHPFVLPSALHSRVGSRHVGTDAAVLLAVRPPFEPVATKDGRIG
jgi:hypothetical protein